MFEGLTIVLVLLVLLYWYLTRHYNYWRSNGVYTAPGLLPGVGHYLEVLLLRKSPEWIHNEIYFKDKGHPAVGMYAFRNPALVIRDLDLIKSVTISEFSSFMDQSLSYDADLDYFMATNPFLLKGQEWKAMRHKISPALTVNRIKTMFPRMKEVCEEFNTYIGTRLNSEIEISKVSGLITCEMVTKCGFSINGDSFDDEKSNIYKAGCKLWDTTIYSPLFMMITYYIPFINKLTRRKFIPVDVLQLFSSIINQAVRLRKIHSENDYLQYLINLQEKDKGFKFNDVVAQSLTFVYDGFVPSSMVVSFAIYELAFNQDIQESLREEIKSVDFTFEDISSLPLLDRIVQETMRLYSEFSLLRTCTKDTVLYSGGYQYPVAKGQEVYIPCYAIHRDPEIFPDPNKFDPDRFLPENVKKRHPLAHLWYGAGPRSCFGKHFGNSQIKVILANIFAKYKVVRCSKTVERPRFCPEYLLPVDHKGLWVKFELL